MFKNILIATDGSDLAAKAVEQGIRFAKEIGAKITAVTVTEPFHVLLLAPSELEYTPIEYKKHAETHAEKVLGAVSAAAKSAGVVCEMLHVEHEQGSESYPATAHTAVSTRRGHRFARTALFVTSDSFAADVKSETMAITDPGNPCNIGEIGTSS